MAGKKVVECVGPSYQLADVKASAQTSVNCYPQRLEGDTWNLVSVPGRRALFGGGPFRGSKVINGRWFFVEGLNLYELDSATGLRNFRAVLDTDTGYVGMDANETQLAIVDGANYYVYNYITDTFTKVISAGWRGSDDVKYIDGYFIFVAPDTDQFYLSAIDDGLTLDPLDFSSADSAPGNIITHRVSNRQLWLFGKGNSTEIWVNSGNPAFPFERYQSYTINVGCVGKRAAVNAADTLFWIGNTDRGTGIVYMAAGNQPQRVSNLAVEQALRTSTDLSGAVMWAYQTEGHEFVGIEVPGLSKTWVYDVSNQLWHEQGRWRDGWEPLGLNFVTHFPAELTFQNAGYATHFAGTDTTLSVLISGRNLEEEIDGGGTAYPLVRERTWPHLIAPSLEPTSFVGLELSMKTGGGQSDVFPETPLAEGFVTLEISNDGGLTFGAPLIRSLGAIGRYMQRVRWLGLGTAFNRVFRIRCSSEVPFTIYSATVDTQ